jgi:23S rRNA pseudouridine2457 synthase
MVSQFLSPDKVGLLGDLPFDFPPGTHAIGRLDQDSEGLLLLTTNKQITRLLFQSKVPHQRRYLVQVNGYLAEEKLQQLRDGLQIKIKTGLLYQTSPCVVERISDVASSFGIAPHPLDRGNNSWLCISLTEGKFRQVRKMIAAIHHRTRRLIRVSIEQLQLGDLAAGEIREVDEAYFFSSLNLAAQKSPPTHDGL